MELNSAVAWFGDVATDDGNGSSQFGIRSCIRIADYFVLYKLFRKSGPGPKNGEQYGAPFREEEWDEDVVDDNHMNQTNSNFQMIENPPNNSVDNELPNRDMNANQNHDLDRMLSQVATELDVVPLNSELHSVNNGSGNQVDNNATNERALNLGQNSLPSYDLEDILLQLSNEQDVMHQLPDSTSYAPNVLQGNGARDDDLDINNFMTPSHYINEVPVQQTNVEEEYLEIEDLINSDCQAQNPDNMNYNSEVNHIGDQFVFPDEYFDTQMFLEDAMGSDSRMNQQNTCWNDFLNNEQQMPASNITADFSRLEQHFSSSTTSVELCTNVTASSSGVMGANNNNTTSSWFDSKFSAFLGTIPSSPAFASENTLLTKALNRVSSFRGGRNKEMRDPYAAVNNNNGINVRKRRQNGGFLFTSFLVGLGAVVWFLSIGITVQIFKGFWNRYFS